MHFYLTIKMIFILGYKGDNTFVIRMMSVDSGKLSNCAISQPRLNTKRKKAKHKKEKIKIMIQNEKKVEKRRRSGTHRRGLPWTDSETRNSGKRGESSDLCLGTTTGCVVSGCLDRRWIFVGFDWLRRNCGRCFSIKKLETHRPPLSMRVGPTRDPT